MKITEENKCVKPEEPISIIGMDGYETYAIDSNTTGVRPKWISVKDQEPPKGKDDVGIPVLTYNKWGSMQVAVYSESEDRWFDADDVIYWMQLPSTEGLSND